MSECEYHTLSIVNLDEYTVQCEECGFIEPMDEADIENWDLISQSILGGK